MFCVWCGVAYVVLLAAGWFYSGLLLPMPPSFTADQVAHFYQTHLLRIRIGMIVVIWSTLWSIPYAAVTTVYIARVERKPGVLTYFMAVGGACLGLFTFFPPYWWLTASFRPDRSPELIQLMNDGAYIMFIACIAMWLAWSLAITVAAFCDKSPDPIFPRWAGYANAFVVLGFLPDQLIYFFRNGIFGWNGLIGFYLAQPGFVGGFIIVNTIVLRRAVLRDRARLLESPEIVSGDYAPV
jgi:hypothetical protein